jgi:DNA primase
MWQLGTTKLDLVRYYLSVADGALRGVADRPMNLKRFPTRSSERHYLVASAALEITSATTRGCVIIDR